MSAFRPTCPRCCYRCDPGSSVCCECGAVLGLDANQLRGLRDYNTIPRMNAHEASDTVPTHGNRRGKVGNR
jgi:hypothetical protein